MPSLSNQGPEGRGRDRERERERREGMRGGETVSCEERDRLGAGEERMFVEDERGERWIPVSAASCCCSVSS